MSIFDLIKRSRSIRRFKQSQPVSTDNLRRFVDCARLSPTGANLQPLKFFLSNDPRTNDKIFGTLAWAGYLQDWAGPTDGERPAAYVVILCDTSIRKQGAEVDIGISAQSIMLAACEAGFGGCMIGSINRSQLRENLALDMRYEISLVCALGVPAETVVIEPVTDGGIKYYRDADGTHHVPKRSLDDVIIS